MKTSEILDKAADLIEERGWTTGEATDPWGLDGKSPVCLEGGILAASGLKGLAGRSLLDKCPAARAVASYLNTSEELWLWNDSGVRTAEQVIEVLRATAVIEAAREEAFERESVSA